MPHISQLLQNAFRPFFLGAAAWAALAIGRWLHMLAGTESFHTLMDPLAWHRHEMIFGYGGGVLTGFLFTAIPNWTRRLPIRGRPLLMLFALWMAGRFANLSSLHLGAVPVAVLDSGFLWLVAGLAAREIAAGRNMKNAPVVLLVAVLAFGSALSHAGHELGWRFGLAALVVLVSLIGGRITPSFTRNWLVKQGSTSLPASFARLDKFGMAMVVVAMALWLAIPESGITALALGTAGAAHLARLVRWCGHRCLAEPLVLILHAGYAWVGAGLLALAAESAAAGLPISAVHVLTAGGIATMTLAVMTRASLGHTGCALRAGPATVMIYVLVGLGALLRVAAGSLPIDHDLTIRLAGTLWGAGFTGFVIAYGPILVRPRSTPQGADASSR